MYVKLIRGFSDSFFVRDWQLSRSEFISDGYPAIVEIVASAKDLKVVSVRYQTFCDIVDFLWLLRLASTLTKYHISHYIESSILIWHFQDGAFGANQARFLSVLKIVPMTFGNFSIDSLLYPRYLVDNLVALIFHQFNSKTVLCVYYPYEEEPIFL